MRKLLLTLTLVALTACGGEVTSDQYLSRAKDYLAESDHASATIELQNALKLDTNLAEARWLLGVIYLQTGQIPAAEHEFQRAQELGWSADDILPAQARTQLAQGNYDEVLALDSKNLSPSAAAGLLASQAIAALANGQMEKSEELVALARSRDPKSHEPTLAEGTILVNQNDYAGALEKMEAVLKEAPDNETAWRLKGQALLRLGRLEEARDALNESIALSKFAFADYLARALINLQLEDFETAQADTTALMEIAPTHPTVNYVQGLLHFQNKRYLDTITALNLAEPAAEQFPMIFYYLGLAYLLEKDVELSTVYAEKYVALSPENSAGRKLYAAALTQTGKVKEAQDVLRPVLESGQADSGVFNILANAYLQDDQAYAGLLLYSQMLKQDADRPIVPLGRESEILTRDAGDAKTPAPVVAPDENANFPQKEILLILEHLEQKDYPAAIEVAKSYQFRDIESRSPYHVLGKVYLAAGEKDNAKEAFDKVLLRDPGDAFANLNLAQLALDANDPGAARAYYQTILRHNSSDLSALLQLAALEAREKNPTALVKRLEQARKAHPAALEPRLALARYHISSGNPDKVAALFESLDELQRKSPRVLEVVGTAQLQQQQYSEALETFEQLAAAVPKSSQVRYMLAMAANGSGDYQKSKAALAEAVTLDPKNIPALLSLARMAHEEGEKEQLAKYLATLIELAPESTDVIRLRALSEQANGNTEEALALAQRAFTQTPTTITAIELVSFLKAAGKSNDARIHLQDWIKKNPRDFGVRIALANHFESERDIQAAKEQYLEVLETMPNNVAALNNLAWNLKDEDPEQALEYIRKASGLVPDNPAVLDTLALIEHLNGDNESARTHVQRALEAVPEEPSIRYHAAMIDAALGDTNEAIKTLEALTAEGAKEFPESADARKLLATLKRS